MKRPLSSLCAVAATTGAALLFALPAMAQQVNGFNPYTNNFEAANNPGATNAPGNYTVTQNQNGNQGLPNDYIANESTVFLDDGGFSSASTGYVGTSTSNAEWAYLATNQSLGTPPVNGAGNWRSGGGASGPYGDPTNNVYQDAVQTHSGSQSILESFQQSGTDGGFERFTTTNGATNTLNRPTVDLGGTVGFWMYVDTGAGTGTGTAPGTTSLNSTSAVDVEIGVNQTNTGQSATDATALGKPGTGGFTEFVYDSTINQQVTNVFPMGGKQIACGSWQYVSFNLASDPAYQVVPGLGTRTRSGLGYLYDINVTPVNLLTGSQTGASVPNQVYNIYIDDLGIDAPAAAPEPSSWVALGAGAAMLLGLGVVRARRRGMASA